MQDFGTIARKTGCGVWIVCVLAGCPRDADFRDADFLGPNVCLQCHTGFIASDRSDYANGAHFAAGVACETCHGPGRLHVRAGGRFGAFINPLRDLPFQRAFEVCAECHESPRDGYLQSRHYQLEAVTCIDCHDPHSVSLTQPEETNALCLQCHESIDFPDDATTDFHTFTFHPVDPAGSGASRCSNCHMPQLEQQEPRGGPRSHSLFTVSPQATLDAAARGDFPVPPNSCAGVAGCHDPAVPGSGPARDVNDLELVESLIPFYERIGRLPEKRAW